MGYEAQSCFTFEGESVQGAPQIIQKLQTLPFQQVQHAPSSCHGQPVPGSPDKVLLLVTGSMMVNGSQNVKFAEVFQLMKKPAGGLVHPEQHIQSGAMSGSWQIETGWSEWSIMPFVACDLAGYKPHIMLA